MDFQDILRFQVENFAPDTHLQESEPPIVRDKTGEIRVVEGFHPLSAEELRAICLDVMGAEACEQFAQEKNWDGSYTLEGVGHFRVNAYVDRHGANLDFRHIPSRIPSMEEIDLPPIAKTLAQKKNGLVLVTGPNGHGKSTTLAAMVDYLNATKHYHILTIEDPIEFIYQRKKSLVSQREIGTHTPDFISTLKRVVRQDVSVIVVGEMRDLETMAATITLAETGHLVLGTLHTQNAASTIERIIDIFPAGQQQQIRTQLSLSLQGIISQTLLPRADGQGRVAAREIIVVDDAVRQLIKLGMTNQINNQIQISRKQGMILFDDSLLDLYARGVITLDQVLAKANDLDSVKRKLLLIGVDIGDPNAMLLRAAQTPASA